MQVVNPRCCGLDVHKQSLVACVLNDEAQQKPEVRTFATTTAGILELGDWLRERQVPIMAMEATGVYWKPVWNLLEDQLKLMLVNAHDVKQVPGRKTDVKDAQWLAELLSCGLLKASFVPDRPQRQLRDLTRGRVSLMQDKSRAANRLQKVLEDANIKLGDVASDVLGKSGRRMLTALIEGNHTPEQMAELAMGALRRKIPALIAALRGTVNQHHRFMLRRLLEQIEHLEKQVDAYDLQIQAVMSPLEQQAVTILDEIPGIDARSAQIIIAEIGTDMSRFATAGHLATWAGLSPGNNESAGKRRSGRMRDGNRWLKATLNQCAWAARNAKNTYFRSQHRRIAVRRGSKRATMAVAHTLLRTAWHLLKNGVAYQDLGADYFQSLNADHHAQRLIKRLEGLGYDVSARKTDAA